MRAQIIRTLEHSWTCVTCEIVASKCTVVVIRTKSFMNNINDITSIHVHMMRVNIVDRCCLKTAQWTLVQMLISRRTEVCTFVCTNAATTTRRVRTVTTLPSLTSASIQCCLHVSYVCVLSNIQINSYFNNLRSHITHK
jgi:hypothetical protein